MLSIRLTTRLTEAQKKNDLSTESSNPPTVELSWVEDEAQPTASLLPPILPHMRCRGALINLAAIILKKSRLLWLVASYETAWLDFITVALGNLALEKATVYEADFSVYVAKGSPLVDGVSVFGENLDVFCNRINRSRIKVVIIKNMEVSTDCDFHSEAFAIAEFIQKKCISAIVILVSYQTPLLICPHLITLPPLTEGQCISYIKKHSLGQFVSDHEIVSGSVFLYTEGLPVAIDKFLKLRQHEDLPEIYLSRLRASRIRDYYPQYLKNVLDELFEEDSDAFELLTVLSLFPMGESIHNIRYFHPKRKLNGRCAIRLEELGLVVAKSLASEALYAPEPYKIVSVVRLIREYMCDCIFPKLEKSTYEGYLLRSAALYFGVDWEARKYKLSGNFLSDKLRLGSVMAGNARFLLTMLIVRADENIENTDQVNKVFDLIFFYVAKLTSTLNFRHVTDLLGDISALLDKHGHLAPVQEIRRCYMYAFRMQGFNHDAIIQYKKVGEIQSPSLTHRISIELAYCEIFLGRKSEAMIISNMIKNANCSDDSKLHGRFISILASDNDKKVLKLEKLARDARARKVYLLANHVKSCLIRIVGDKDQKITLLRNASAVAQNDGDSLNFIRNTVDMAEMIVESGQTLSNTDINSLIDCYHFAHIQRSKFLFERIHALLWEASELSGDFNRLLELYIRSSALGQIMNFDRSEKYYLVRLLACIPANLDTRSDTRFIYVAHRAVELNLIADENLSSVLIENATTFFLQNPKLA
ncbi:hypothetical protein SFA35_25770 (plasmid) [Pseudomonas sp. HR96]|uniref:hypothetical protein n=1 Tax=Pseudomonas sp. HR96 TaxID=1027966 RepID=UPI002A7640A5|nr:hypothetical protein [Pseudomonas sp. HR96]WPP02403.1 hypothetical protein SFA35_25770 [Pseudomonas sp. HR96]